MNESKREQFRGRARRMLARFFNRYLVLRTFAALTFFALSFGFFSVLLKRSTDLGKFLIAGYGLFVVLLCGLLVVEYVIKTIRLQRTQVVKNYSAIVAVNTLFGVIMPLFYTNIILAVVIRALAHIRNYGSFFCDVRCGIVNFYYNNQVYVQIHNLIFWIVLMAIVLFIFGGFLERLQQSRK